MKALTIKQPWADLIAIGKKNIENRTWKTNYRGRVLIHASKLACTQRHLENYPLPALKNSIDIKEYSMGDMLCGAIIGSVEIVDCVRNHPSEWAEEGVYNWVLARPILFKEPIMNIKGSLGLWEYGDDKAISMLTPKMD